MDEIALQDELGQLTLVAGALSDDATTNAAEVATIEQLLGVVTQLALLSRAETLEPREPWARRIAELERRAVVLRAAVATMGRDVTTEDRHDGGTGATYWPPPDPANLD